MDRLVLELKSESKATSIPVAANDVNDDDVAATTSLMMVITFHQKHNSNHYELVLSMFNFLAEFFNLELLARSKLNFIKALACLHIELRTFVQRSTRPPYQLWKHHFLSDTGSHVLIGECLGRLTSIARGNKRATLKREKNLLMLR